jgi:Protein of unknown function (DUF3562)
MSNNGCGQTDGIMSPRIRTATGAAFEPRGTFHEHIIAIHELAHDFDLPEPMVADMYWPELARLQKGATIDVYLPLLTERRVRKRLRRSGRSDETRRSEAHEGELVAG